MENSVFAPDTIGLKPFSFPFVMPRSRGYGNVTATYIRRSKYPYIYTLSISTDKNQGTEARGALYIPIYEYNYKIITGCDTILQEYYIIDRRKCENTKDLQ